MSDDPTPEEFADPANWHPIEEHPYLNDPPNDPPMSDLRDRIAAVLSQHDVNLPDKVADAVIADLGLQRASKPNDYDHVQYPPGDRYITDWITNG